MRFKIIFVFLSCIFYMFAYSASVHAESDNLYLITSIDNFQNQTVNKRALIAIYSLRTRKWPNGNNLTVFVLEDRHTLHQQFCQQILGVLPYHLRRSWDRLIFSGKAKGPVEVNDMEEMKKMVSMTPGSIGYITQNFLDDSVITVRVN